MSYIFLLLRTSGLRVYDIMLLRLKEQTMIKNRGASHILSFQSFWHASIFSVGKYIWQDHSECPWNLPWAHWTFNKWPIHPSTSKPEDLCYQWYEMVCDRVVWRGQKIPNLSNVLCKIWGMFFVKHGRLVVLSICVRAVTAWGLVESCPQVGDTDLPQCV